jgi:uncharacterized lipoprotein YmbA
MGLAVQLSACSRSPAVRFYTLSATPVNATAGADDIAVSVGPAQFPRSLARNQIVTRNGDTQVLVDEYNVWAASLESAFLGVLGDNIANQLDSDQVVVYPVEAPFDVDYKVMLDVLQFDGVLGESASLRVRWVIMQAGETLKVDIFSSTLAIADGETSYDALVATYSAATGELSQVIAAELIRLSQGSTP